MAYAITEWAASRHTRPNRSDNLFPSTPMPQTRQRDVAIRIGIGWLGAAFVCTADRGD